MNTKWIPKTKLESSVNVYIFITKLNIVLIVIENLFIHFNKNTNPGKKKVQHGLNRNETNVLCRTDENIYIKKT